ncbi:MAG TPA: 50S ribosomal protein L25 [Armatimonadota bacterium]|nr:50S ribosomal protein L25 [Armatimonadota bacterium]
MRAEQVEIAVTVRAEAGKSASRRLRARGQIPAVVYGRGVDPVAVSVDEGTFARSVPPAGWYSTLISLKIEGGDGEADGPTVMIKEVQNDLAMQQVLSIDFQRISLLEMIQTRVPIRHVGQSPGVKQGGIVDQVTHEVVVECLPTAMPDHLEADISGLEIGDSVRVRDLIVPPEVKVMAPEDEAVIVIAAPVREEEVAPTVPEEGILVEEAAEPEVIGETEGGAQSAQG